MSVGEGVLCCPPCPSLRNKQVLDGFQADFQASYSSMQDLLQFKKLADLSKSEIPRGIDDLQTQRPVKSVARLAGRTKIERRERDDASLATRSFSAFLFPSFLSVFFPLCKSDFPSLVGLPAFSVASPSVHLLPPARRPPARPPGPFQSISNLKFYETKLKLTSHLGDRGP